VDSWRSFYRRTSIKDNLKLQKQCKWANFWCLQTTSKRNSWTGALPIRVIISNSIQYRAAHMQNPLSGCGTQ
jgi:hypothetical protein